MTIHSYLVSHLSENRVYFDLEKKLKYSELQRAITPAKGLEYKGVGIRCYSKFIGWVLKVLKLAVEVNMDGKTFYLNNRSVCQFMIRKHETDMIMDTFGDTDKVARFEETTLRLDYFYRRHKCLGYRQISEKEVLQALKEAVPGGRIRDADQFEELILKLQSTVAKPKGHKEDVIAEKRSLDHEDPTGDVDDAESAETLTDGVDVLDQSA